MIITFPYFDPNGKFNDSFRRQLPTLKSRFDTICLSVVSPTIEKNSDFVQYLESQGCLLTHNALETKHAAHSRAPCANMGWHNSP